jgi:ech hydrogenase subunit D
MAQVIEQQDVVAILREELPARAAQLAKDGWRIVHVACIVQGDQLELLYAFDKAYKLVNYRVLVPKSDPVVPSISATYLAAFAYENELQDLFGMKVEGLVLDFKGKFYRKRHEAPFNPACAAAPAAAPAPAAGK